MRWVLNSRGGVMDYPWWTIDAADWGFRDEDEIHCHTCAETHRQVLVRELTDSEINQLGGVTCQICGRNWPRVEPALAAVTASSCAAE